MKDNNWLVDYCKAQVGRPYWFGTFGQVGSASLYQSKQNQYPNNYPPKKFTKDSFVKQYGKKVHDCAGLIKGAIWCDSFDDPTPTYKSSEDYGANKFFTNATKNGTMNTFIDLPGILVFKGTDKQKTHVGVYIGNGKVIEAKGHTAGVVISDVSGFKYWSMCNLISYSDAILPADPKPTPAPPAESSNGGYTEAEVKAAYDCIRGKYGNGATRKQKLKQAGFDYVRVQGLVNKILQGKF